MKKLCDRLRSRRPFCTVQIMESAQVKQLVEEATFEFTLGDHNKAIDLLNQALEQQPDNFAALHALAEVQFAAGQYPAALAAAQRAMQVHEADVHLHTTLSRIHMEMGDKETAEQHGARARVLGWKATLAGEDEDGSLN